MNKLPVGETIRQAYAFTFGEIGTIIGLTWIPTVINTVALYFMLRAYAVSVESLETGAPPTDPMALLPLPLAILSLFLTAMIGVVLTRQVLGLRKGPALAHFSVGREELRVFAGFVGLYLLMILFFFLFATVVAGVAAGASHVAAAAASAITGAAGMVGIFLLIFAVFRLGYLLVPAAVVEGQFGLTRSWQLSQGNFWRLVAVMLATLIPPMLVSDIAAALVSGPMPQGPATPPADLAGFIHLWAEQVRATVPHLPALMGVSLVLAPLFYSLLFAPAAIAYRVLSGKAVLPAPDS